MILLAVISLLPSISGLLTDPGPLCPGDMATLTCNITGGVGQRWRYNTMDVGDLIIHRTGQVPAVVDGVEFRLSLLSTSGDPYLATQIAFVASERMDGGMLECGTIVDFLPPVVETVTLQIGSSSPPSNVRLSNSILPIHGIGQSDVTIEWTPPPNGGNGVMYTIGTTPAPLSGAMSVTTSSTQTTITVRHNTNYTVTVGVNTTCAGVQEATGTIHIAGCPRPLPPMDGSIISFLATNEGAEIVYHCDPGFQPQSNLTAMCASNGSWTPDPAQQQCIADCGTPAIPSNASVLGDVSSTTENAIVTFQCEEGLIPSHPITITCTRNGQWSPDPTSVQCVTEDTPPTGIAGTSPGVYIGVAFAVVTVLVVTLVVALVIWVYCRRRRRRIKTIPKISGYRIENAAVISGEKEETRNKEDESANTERDSIQRISEYPTISSRQLTLGRILGQGEFGMVYQAKLRRNFDNDVVAVKTLKGFVVESNVEDLRKECAKMSEFDHPNVLTLIGVCLDGGPAPYIIMPFMENGSLLSYLKKERENLVLEPGTDEDAETQTRRLLDMCLQVAKGMEYLANRRVIHRDLAARNCMIDFNFVIKVADFGLSESIDTSKQYFRQDKQVAVRLPIKWLAPESINDGIFSEKTDVWSYGVTCWEIFSGGKTPYPGIHPVDLPYQLEKGHRMKKPPNEACSDEIFSHMLRCWETKSESRPTFGALVSEFSSQLQGLAAYLELNETML